MNTIIGASLTTRTDGLGTARYSDPVSGSGGGGYQGPQGWQGDLGGVGPQGDTGSQGPSGGGGGGSQGPQGWQGPQGPQGNQGNQGWQGFQGPGNQGGGGTPGDTIPIIISKQGHLGVQEIYRRDDTVPGTKLVGDPADGTAAAAETLEFTTGAQGLQVKLGNNYTSGDAYKSLAVSNTAGGKGLIVKVGADYGLNVRTAGITLNCDSRVFATGPVAAPLYSQLDLLANPNKGLGKSLADNLYVKLEAPGPGTGGLLFNGSGELYTVWQADP